MLDTIPSQAITMILEQIDNEITKIKDALNKLKSIKKLKAEKNTRTDFKWCAIDSSWQSPPVEFISNTVAIVFSGAYSNLNNLNKLSVNPFVYNGSNFEVEVYWYSTLKERELAREILLQGDLDLLILDGTITPSPALATTPWEKVEKSIKITDNLLKTAKKTNTTIVGVVKRAKAKYLSSMVNLDVSDKLLATLLLDPEEYIILGNLKDLIHEYIIAKGHRTGEFLSRLSKSASFINDITEVYYRPHHRHSIRVEIIEYGPTIHETISYLIHNTNPHTGYPIMLDIVDKFVTKNKIPTNTLKTILENSINSRYKNPLDAKIAYALCGLENPQKTYLYR